MLLDDPPPGIGLKINLGPILLTKKVDRQMLVSLNCEPTILNGLHLREASVFQRPAALQFSPCKSPSIRTGFVPAEIEMHIVHK